MKPSSFLTLFVAGILVNSIFCQEGYAQERQFRQLTLTDGRVLRAEVLATEGTGLRMRMPQGEALISFELLMDMVPISGSEYEDQADERLWLVVDGEHPGVQAVFDAIPGLSVSQAGASKLNGPQTNTLEPCGVDIACARRALRDADWVWLAFVAPPSDSSEAELILRGGPSGSPRVLAVETGDDPRGLWNAAHELLGLKAPIDVPKAVVAAFPKGTEITKVVVPKEAWTIRRVNRSSFVPLPGYTSLAQGDAGRFGMGLGIGLAGTGAVAAVAATSIKSADGEIPDIPTIIAVSAGAYWVFSGLLNNALGHATRNSSMASASVTPLRNGAMFSVSSTF